MFHVKPFTAKVSLFLFRMFHVKRFTLSRSTMFHVKHSKDFENIARTTCISVDYMV